MSISHISILKSIKDAVIVSKLNGNILYANEAAEILFNYKPGELIGNNLDIIFPPGLKHEKKKLMESILWGEDIDSYETERVDSNNNLLFVSVSLSSLKDDEGKLIGVTKVIRNISEKRRSEGKFQALLESAPDAMVIVNNFGQMILVNAQTEKLFNYNRSELMGEGIEKLLPSKVNYSFNDTKVREMGADLDLFGVRKDGSEFPVEIRLSPIEMEDEKLVSAAIRDITKQKKSAIDLKKYADQLEVSNKELKQFAYVASHDLKVPLRKILIFTDRMLSNSSITEKGRTYFQFIKNTAGRMDTLIKDLLSYSSLANDKVFQTRNLNKIVEGVIKTFKEEIEEKNAIVETNELCEADIIVFQFRQLMHNLISNALKFSKSDVPPRIKIKARHMKGSDLQSDKLQPDVEYCHIFVSDNGIGIEEEYQEKVFEVFEKLHSNDEYEGTGIGLAIVKKIVDNHEGLITARSVLNAGTTFDIYLPLHNKNAENEHES